MSKAPSPYMAATACAVLALELLFFSGASLMGWFITIPDIFIYSGLMWRVFSWTHSIPKIDGVKVSLRVRVWVVCKSLVVFSSVLKLEGYT